MNNFYLEVSYSRNNIDTKENLRSEEKLKPVSYDRKDVDLESDLVIITQESDNSGPSSFVSQNVESDDEVTSFCTHNKIKCFDCFNQICVQCDMQDGN